MSHLTAIHRAVYDKGEGGGERGRERGREGGKEVRLSSEYALIMEDDVAFQFDIDFEKLIQLAPNKDFGKENV